MKRKRMKGLSLMEGSQAVISLVFIGIVLGVGVLVTTSFQNTLVVNSTAFHALTNATQGITSVGAQLPTVGLLVGVGLIFAALGLGIGFLLNRRSTA